MTMHKVLPTRDDVNRLYVSRKEVGRRLADIEDSVDASIQRFEDYIEKCIGRLITATRNNTNDERISRTKITRKQKKGKKNNSMNILSDISRKKTSTWQKMKTLRKKMNLL